MLKGTIERGLESRSGTGISWQILLIKGHLDKLSNALISKMEAEKLLLRSVETKSLMSTMPVSSIRFFVPLNN